MFNIIVGLKGQPLNFNFTYLTEEKAKDDLESIKDILLTNQEKLVHITDETGHVGIFYAKDVLGAFFSGMEQDLSVNEDIQIIRARSQARAQRKAQNDPVLAMHQSQANIPPQMIQ